MVDTNWQSRSGCDGESRGGASWRDNFDEEVHEVHGGIHFASSREIRERMVSSSRALSGSAFDWDSARSVLSARLQTRNQESRRRLMKSIHGELQRDGLNRQHNVDLDFLAEDAHPSPNDHPAYEQFEAGYVGPFNPAFVADSETKRQNASAQTDKTTHSQWHQELSHARTQLFSATEYIEELESVLAKSNQASVPRADAEKADLADGVSPTTCIVEGERSVGEGGRPDEKNPLTEHKGARFGETPGDGTHRVSETCRCRWAEKLVDCVARLDTCALRWQREHQVWWGSDDTCSSTRRRPRSAGSIRKPANEVRHTNERHCRSRGQIQDGRELTGRGEQAWTGDKERNARGGYRAVDTHYLKGDGWKRREEWWMANASEESSSSEEESEVLGNLRLLQHGGSSRHSNLLDTSAAAEPESDEDEDEEDEEEQERALRQARGQRSRGRGKVTRRCSAGGAGVGEGLYAQTEREVERGRRRTGLEGLERLTDQYWKATRAAAAK